MACGIRPVGKHAVGLFHPERLREFDLWLAGANQFDSLFCTE